MHFFPPCCCQEMNKWLSMFGGEYQLGKPARFSQLILFSPYKAGNEISLSAVSPHVVVPPRPPSSQHLCLFYQDILCRGEEEGTSSPSLKKRNCL